MAEILNTFVVITALLLPGVFGFLSIRHYFDIIKSGESLTISKINRMSYGQGMEVRILKGKQAIKDARTHLINGIILLSISLPIYLWLIYKILADWL